MPERRGRKRIGSGNQPGHTIYMEDTLWDAAGDLPESRQEIAREAFLNKIEYYQSDLPKLRWQLEDIKKQIRGLQSKEDVILKRIEQLEAKAVVEVSEAQEASLRYEILVRETSKMCKAFKKKLSYSHYIRLSELSGVEAAKIEVFIKDSNFRPSEEKIKEFYVGAC